MAKNRNQPVSAEVTNEKPVIESGTPAVDGMPGIDASAAMPGIDASGATEIEVSLDFPAPSPAADGLSQPGAISAESTSDIAHPTSDIDAPRMYSIDEVEQLIADAVADALAKHAAQHADELRPVQLHVVAVDDVSREEFDAGIGSLGKLLLENAEKHKADIERLRGMDEADPNRAAVARSIVSPSVRLQDAVRHMNDVRARRTEALYRLDKELAIAENAYRLATDVRQHHEPMLDAVLASLPAIEPAPSAVPALALAE